MGGGWSVCGDEISEQPPQLEYHVGERFMAGERVFLSFHWHILDETAAVAAAGVRLETD